MTIHQIQIRHDEAEDRLLLRFTTVDHCEVRFWLTRSFTRRLWKLLVQMLEWDRAVIQQIDPVSRRTVLDLQHEGYSREADYATPFAESTPDAPRRLLLGEAPVLLAQAYGTKRSDGVQVLRLHPMNGQGIDVTLDTRLLHIFTRLLREQVAKTDWDLALALHEPSETVAAADDPPGRRLN